MASVDLRRGTLRLREVHKYREEACIPCSFYRTRKCKQMGRCRSWQLLLQLLGPGSYNTADESRRRNSTYIRTGIHRLLQRGS